MEKIGRDMCLHGRIRRGYCTPDNNRSTLVYGIDIQLSMLYQVQPKKASRCIPMTYKQKTGLKNRAISSYHASFYVYKRTKFIIKLYNNITMR